MKFLLVFAPIAWTKCPNPNPCVNQGACVPIGTSYQCRCKENGNGVTLYVGEFCEAPNPCVGYPCNDGKCEPQPIAQRHGVDYKPKCQCDVGYTGPNCEVISRCQSKPCDNGGKCIEVADKTFTCQCVNNFTGPRCKQVNHCSSNRCSGESTCVNELDSYRCECPNVNGIPTFFGKNCDVDVDECSNKPCKNGGICRNTKGAYECQCEDPWFGKNCEEKAPKMCDRTYCVNGACMIDSDTGLSTCQCHSGYEGLRCDVNTDDCPANECQNNADCVDKIDGYECICKPGWKGRYCNEDVDECTSLMGTPCKNGATCVNLDGDYECMCINGWTGKNCDGNYDDCIKNQCYPGSECIDEVGKHSCKCQKGRIGEHCHLEDKCYPTGEDWKNPCGEGNECTGDFLTGNPLCYCETGLTGDRCQIDVDECIPEQDDQPPICHHNGACVNTFGSYHCECADGYEGPFCDLNTDDCTPNPCYHGGTCLDGVGEFHCSCTEGYAGKRCEHKKDYCKDEPCLNGNCIDQEWSYTCECNPGYYGDRCEKQYNECTKLKPCQNGASCIDLINDYKCNCRPGYNGRNCSVEINECEPEPCHHGTCNDYVNQFVCTCDSGWSGDLCESEINECEPNPCFNDAKCIDKVGSYECICPVGTTGLNCRDTINECENVECLNNGIARDVVGKCVCECPPGFEGKFCQTDIDECANNPCLNNGKCTDMINGYKCSCSQSAGQFGKRCYSESRPCQPNPCRFGKCKETSRRDGFFKCDCDKGWQGDLCDMSACDAMECQNGGSPRPSPRQYSSAACSCDCLDGFEGQHCEISTQCKALNPCVNGRCMSSDGEQTYCVCTDESYTGKFCDKPIDPCHENPCKNSGKCMKNTRGERECECPEQWTGPLCEIDVDECDKYRPCHNGGECINNDSGYSCQCPAGYKGRHCEEDIDDCATDPCRNSAMCINNDGPGYRCNCKRGFHGRKCELETDECLTNPCMNHGECIDMVASYQCKCTSGFRGERCETKIHMCSKTSCFNGGTCVEVSGDGGDLSYQCNCAPGYTGVHCETEINECLSNPCLNNGVCIDNENGYDCKCTLGFSGENCENLVDVCSLNKNRCLNGATCVNGGNRGYTCTCPDNWQGEFCDTPRKNCDAIARENKIARSQVCKNGGICVDQGDWHQCRCEPGYDGDHCERETNPCENVQCYNGGQCIEQNDKYSCKCLPAWKGTQCRESVKPCEPNNCKNFGTCVVTPYDHRRSFLCSCRPGTSGTYCQNNEDNCIDVMPNGEHPCKGHGTCIDGITKQSIGTFECKCDQGYTGDRCGTIVNLCRSHKPCNNAGTKTCVPKPNDYSCECKPGFYGATCEKYKTPEVDLCTKENPCMNQAKCTLDPFSDQGFKCHCKEPGSYGDRCEDKRKRCGGVYCYNSASCTSDGRCSCLEGYGGERCELLRTNPVCQYPGITECDRRCNNPECNFCEGGCTLDTPSPWDKCPSEFDCARLFDDGVCDEQCKSEDCLFDGRDCEPPQFMQQCPFEEYCRKSYNNGQCDEGCNRAECAWDGLDCDGSLDPEYATGELMLVVDVDYKLVSQNETYRNEMLRTISIILHTNLVVVLNIDGTLKIKKVSTDATYSLYGRQRRATSIRSSNTELYFQVDNRACSTSGLYCFQDAMSAQNMLAAEYQRGNTATPGFNMLTAGYDNGNPVIEPTVKLPMYLVLGSCMMIMTITVFYVVVTQRKKRIRSKLWTGIPIPEQPPTKKIVTDNGPKSVFPMHPYQSSGAYMSPSQSGHDFSNAKYWNPNSLGADERSPLVPYDDTVIGINQQGPDGIGPLHITAKSGTEVDKNGRADQTGTNYDGEDVITRLVNQGVGTDMQTDTYNETPLHFAARYARADAAKKLLAAGADPNVRDWTGRTPLHGSIAADAHGVFTILLNDRRTELEARADDGSTALILAARLEIENVVEQLIQHHVDVNAVDYAGKSALHWAAEVNNKQSCELLLKHGANKDIQNEREETPLFLAAKEGSLDCVRILLQHFANRDITDFMDRLPRDIASQKMHNDIVDLLDKPISQTHGMFDVGVAPFPMNQYASKKMQNNTKKRPRQANQSRVSAGKRKKTSGFASTAQLYSKSSGNVAAIGGYGHGMTGSTTLSPPNDRTPPHHPHHTQGAYHTLQPSRLQHSQSIAHGLATAHPYLMNTVGVDLNHSMPYHSSTLYEHNWSMHQKQMIYHQHRYSHITHSAIQSPISNHQSPYPFSYQSALEPQKSPEFYPQASPEGPFPSRPTAENESARPPACYLTPSPESPQDGQWNSPSSNESHICSDGPPLMQNATFSPGLNPTVHSRPKSHSSGNSQPFESTNRLQF